MMYLFILLLAISTTLCHGGQVYHDALDDYVWTPDENYGWVDMVIFFVVLQYSF